MITVQLLPHAEKRADANPLKLRLHPLYHQMRTFEALRQCDVVMNTYNTGTGKTVASLLHLFDLKETGKNVLFIAPTNALLAQHAADIERFVKAYGLDFEVLRITAAAVRQIDSQERPGKVLHHLLRNYLQYAATPARRRPLILVVNPDIFYYAMFAQYGPHDRRNLLEDFILRFDYIVIDEFHYYDSKQLANFLFVLALFDQFGYFDVTGRKVCLLSATPLPYVADYLNRLFGDRWQMVSPHNEPAEAAALETIPSLAPLRLTLLDAQLGDWITAEKETLRRWLAEQQDGAIISSSLWRINHAHTTLRAFLPAAQVGRITGPESDESRQKATARALILASPTVDIGYNFDKMGKERQNIDFLVCDARYRDGLLQRIGRAGRILGKKQTHHHSQAVALLPTLAIQSLNHLHGQTLDRSTFNQHVNNCQALPAKHSLTRYIDSHAITECFYPIFQLGYTMPPHLHHELEELFNRVRETFAPRSGRTYGGLKGFFYKYEKRKRWYHETKKNSIPFNKETAVHLVDWLKWLEPGQVEYQPADVVSELPNLLGHEEQQQALRAFVNSQLAVTNALFNFRDAFQGPRAVVYDPGHLLSSETFNAYDLFHLLRHYKLSPPLTAAQFRRQHGQTNLEGDFYFHLLGWRDTKLTIRFACEATHDRDMFEQMWCGAPIGLTGLQLRAGEPGKGVMAGALPAEITAAIADQTIPAFVVPPGDAGMAYARLHGTAIWSHSLIVYFPDGTADEEYRVFFGKAAFFAHAELAGHFLLKDRLKPDAIIL